MGMLSFLFGSEEKVDYGKLVKEGAKIIDVRSPNEFAGGHAPKSINIPLQSIKDSINKIEHFNKPIILVCRSGARAAQANGILKKAGIESYNAGAWQNMK